ncbi:MAG: valine--tRNA ligase [Thermoguttaceae bacterium]|jgi:valyl-tRNA synthetase|nr:valine--tRNA ligase [Thermoguttaceae bacterium]
MANNDLPKQYDHKAAQERWYPFWEEQGFFHAEPDAARKPYCIVIPPPNVTGALHLGHALNNTLQDILIRQKRMQGFATLWMPGTDHAGIATQAVVERRLLQEDGVSRHTLGRDGLVERIWQWKNEYETRILGQLKQMGCSCDWQRTRFTLDPVCARAVRHTFFRMFKDRLIYRGKRLVNWDTMLRTAVSDDEVFHEAVPGHFWYFHYPVIGPKPDEPKQVTIATTRPETMLGDTAVAVHPDPAGALDKAEADLAARLRSAPAKQRPEIEAEIEEVRRRRREMLPELEKLRDMALAGRRVLLPLLNRDIPLVADEWAKPEMGTGCVKITPAHDPNDYEVGLRQNLPMVSILNLDGTLSAEAGPYQGQTVMEARKNVVADLEKQGLMLKVEDREIDLAHSDRSKTPIEPLLTDQWFLRMEQLAQMAMDAVVSGRVRILPERYTKGYLDWLGEKRDWPISRQLWWGHQIPVWYCDSATEKDLSMAFAGRDDVVWHRDDESGQWLICALEEDLSDDAVPGHALRREQDVLDTWFSSALWPHSTLGWPEQTPELDYFYPTDVLITSRDIITLWVARMVLTGLYNLGEVPFPEVYIHPKILDGYGEGMSKSKGNGVDPLDVMEKFGADSLRFGLAYLTTETQDIRMPVDFECPHCHKLMEQTRETRVMPRVRCPACGGEFSTQWAEKPADRALPRGAVVSDRFELARNFCNKLWNASRFVMMNLEGYTPGEVADAELTVEDRWVLSRLATVTGQVTDLLAVYKYADAARALYDFAWDEFCSFFVEMAKARLGNPSTRPAVQRVLAHTLDTLLRLLHPMIPFLTEDVWQRLGALCPERGLPTPEPPASSIIVAPWPQPDAARIDPHIEAQFARFQDVLRAVRDIRARQNVPPKKAVHFAVRCDPETAALLAPLEPYFANMAGAHPLGMGPAVEPPALSANVTAAGLEVFVDLAELIDVEAELTRKRQELDKLATLIAGKEKKLSNASFIDRAPAAVVQKERDSLADLQQQHAATAQVLGQLADDACLRARTGSQTDQGTRSGTPGNSESPDAAL